MNALYCIAGKFGEFGGSIIFVKLKPSKLVLIINNLLVDLLIRQTFFRQMLEESQLTKLYPRQTFLLYGSVIGIGSAESYSKFFIATLVTDIIQTKDAHSRSV